MLRAGQRVVVPSEGGGCAQHSVGQVWAQVCAVGRVRCGQPVQGVGTAWVGKVHPAVDQVLCMEREVSQWGLQQVTGHMGWAVALGMQRAALFLKLPGPRGKPAYMSSKPVFLRHTGLHRAQLASARSSLLCSDWPKACLPVPVGPCIILPWGEPKRFPEAPSGTRGLSARSWTGGAL